MGFNSGGSSSSSLSSNTDVALSSPLSSEVLTYDESTAKWKNAVVQASVADDSITNANISTTAAIAQEKIANLVSDLQNKADANLIGAANGIASLDTNSTIPLTQIAPSLKTASGARPVAINELTLNVYDFGAINDDTVSSQTALDSAMAVAFEHVQAEYRVTIKIPYGRVRGNFLVTNKYICFEGPGTLVGEIRFQSTAQNALPRFYSTIYNLVFETSDIAATVRPGGIHIVGGAMIEVTSCLFINMTYAVHADTWPNLAGQQNKTLNVHDNVMINVEYAMKCTNQTGTTWAAHADMKFSRNIIRHAYTRGISIAGCDGFDIEDNIFFALGFSSTNTRVQDKTETIYIGRASNFVTIRNNKVFEAGNAGIMLDAVQNSLVQGNQVVWSGQVRQVAGIRVVVDSGVVTNNVLITDNIVDEGTQHGISIVGTGDASNVTITDTNSIKLFKSSTRNVYIGQSTLVTNDLARIFVQDTIVNYPRIDSSQHSGSRQGVIAVKGIFSLTRKQTHSDYFETSISLSKQVSESTAFSVCALRSTDSSPQSTQFAGTVRVVLKNYLGNPASVPRVAQYTFSVEGYTKAVTNVQTAGLVAASGDGANPSFTFSITAGGTLIATPQGATNGTYEMSVYATGYLQTGYTLADFNALPLSNPV